MLIPPAADGVLLAVAVVLASGIVAGWAAARLRVLDVVLYILAGVVVGPHGLDWLQSAGASLGTEVVFVFGSAFILYEGGREIDVEALREVWRSVALLSSLGVAATTAIMGLLGWWLLGLPLPTALLLGAVLSPTDPASVIPLFRSVRVGRRLAQTVVAESACNDATSAALSAALLGAAGTAATAWWHAGVNLVGASLGGLAIGGAVAVATAFLMAGGGRRLPFIAHDEHGPILSVLTVLVAFLLAQQAGASGFMAVFAAGVVHGNPSLVRWIHALPEERRRAHHAYLSVTGHLARMGIFVLLGAQVDLRLLGSHLGPAALLTVALVFLARPASVLLSVLPDRPTGWRWQEMAMLSWVRETGVIAAALAGALVARGVSYGPLIAATVLLVVLVTLLGQAPSTGAVARRLGLLQRPGEARRDARTPRPAQGR